MDKDFIDLAEIRVAVSPPNAPPSSVSVSTPSGVGHVLNFGESSGNPEALLQETVGECAFDRARKIGFGLGAVNPLLLWIDRSLLLPESFISIFDVQRRRIDLAACVLGLVSIALAQVPVLLDVAYTSGMPSYPLCGVVSNVVKAVNMGILLAILLLLFRTYTLETVINARGKFDPFAERARAVYNSHRNRRTATPGLADDLQAAMGQGGGDADSSMATELVRDQEIHGDDVVWDPNEDPLLYRTLDSVEQSWRGLRLPFLCEVIVCLLQPYPYLFGCEFDQLLAVASFLRVYLVIRVIRNKNPLYMRRLRIATAKNPERVTIKPLGSAFSIRYLFTKYPTSSSLVTIILFTFVSAVSFLLTERQTTELSMTRALYWAAVSLSTMGYGDITPDSGLGQLVACLTGFGGIILTSMLVSSVTSFLNTSKFEKFALRWEKQHSVYQEREKAAASFIAAVYKLYRFRLDNQAELASTGYTPSLRAHRRKLFRLVRLAKQRFFEASADAGSEAVSLANYAYNHYDARLERLESQLGRVVDLLSTEQPQEKEGIL